MKTSTVSNARPPPPTAKWLEPGLHQIQGSSTFSDIGIYLCRLSALMGSFSGRPRFAPRACLPRDASWEHLSSGLLAQIGCGARKSCIDDGYGSGPTGRRSVNFHRETGDLKSAGGQLLKVVQFLDVAVADLASSFASFPDHGAVAFTCVAFSGVSERRVSAPCVGSGQPDAVVAVQTTGGQ